MGRMYARVRNEQNGAKIMNEVKRNADEAETARRNKIRRAYVLAGVGVLILALIYLVYTALAVKKFTVMYNVVLIGALLAFWVLTDIMAPVKAHDFDDRTPEQMGTFLPQRPGSLRREAALGMQACWEPLFSCLRQ